MPTWPTKDPQDVADYTNTWDLGGDTIASSVFTFVNQAGLVKDSESFAGLICKVWLSGGSAGEIGVLINRVVTSGGRQFDSQPIYIPIAETYTAPTTGYVLPTASQLVAIYPEFASVGNIDFWITRAARNVDTSWTEGDYGYAIILYAAHLMASNGQGTGPEVAGSMSGYSEIRSGQLTLKRKTNAEIGGNDGSLTASTSYGRMYLDLLRKNRPRAAVAWKLEPYPGYIRYPHGEA